MYRINYYKTQINQTYQFDLHIRLPLDTCRKTALPCYLKSQKRIVTVVLARENITNKELWKQTFIRQSPRPPPLTTANPATLLSFIILTERR